MSERVERTLLRISLGAGLVAVATMLGPWAGSGRVDRSIFGVVSSASALDLLSGVQKSVVLASLVLVIVAVAIAVVGMAWDLPLVASVALMATGPILSAAGVAIGVSPLALRWAGYLSGGAGVVASICAVMVVAAHSRRRTNTT